MSNADLTLALVAAVSMVPLFVGGSRGKWGEGVCALVATGFLGLVGVGFVGALGLLAGVASAGVSCLILLTPTRPDWRAQRDAEARRERKRRRLREHSRH